MSGAKIQNLSIFHAVVLLMFFCELLNIFHAVVLLMFFCELLNIFFVEKFFYIFSELLNIFCYFCKLFSEMKFIVKKILLGLLLIVLFIIGLFS